MRFLNDDPLNYSFVAGVIGAGNRNFSTYFFLFGVRYLRPETPGSPCSIDLSYWERQKA
ncbi:class Ib ribonucleoside-diphosphate reductase assembly flavoprotein NrdI [Sodalis-like endosymbiont of Proechinophthirus fluctus]|uniref:class Ib ribonucleoside-diphosphate reductase assembly flavoprotein NrdI n=1 Tax=Sodalis-like endosymbiont of Proechinophthirus fluctus TaxID=1462730 RepID=UPI001FCC2D10|nr:class Ib ribonucleoside-diphosphate reductase assembly flavoprotein NrdI [Sodalis-like endosymbiont of Proechinophthirus fluctus]